MSEYADLYVYQPVSSFNRGMALDITSYRHPKYIERYNYCTEDSIKLMRRVVDDNPSRYAIATFSKHGVRMHAFYRELDKEPMIFVIQPILSQGEIDE